MHHGFTLTEVMIVIAIAVVLAVAALPIYGNLQVASQINESTDLIIQTLRVAQERSQARVNNSNHGVWLGSRNYVLYQGMSYVVRDSNYDRAQEIDPAIIISTTLPGNEINFSKSMGVPDNIGTIILTHSNGHSRVIQINELGAVEEE